MDCNAATAPENGGIGDCTNVLALGASCQPTCGSGFTVSGPTNCSSKGELTAATCIRKPTFSFLNDVL